VPFPGDVVSLLPDDVDLQGPIGPAPVGNGILLAASIRGPVKAGFTGIRANGNALAGISSFVYTDHADSTVSFKDVVACDNSQGIFSYQSAYGGSASARFRNVKTKRNFGAGVTVSANASDTASISFANVESSRNFGPGIVVQDLFVAAARNGNGGSGDLYIFGRGNVLRDNFSHGIYIGYADPEGEGIIDFGGGELGSPGLNSITGNGAVGFWNDSDIEALAKFNFWGNVPPVLNADFSDDVDASDHLTTDPNS